MSDLYMLIDVALIKNNAAIGSRIAFELNKMLIANVNTQQTSRVVTIGGTNVDIVARTSQLFEPKTSNIGGNKVIIGGVGRNVTECLYKLGLTDTLFISILGNDFYKDLCLKNFAENRMVSHSNIVNK